MVKEKDDGKPATVEIIALRVQPTREGAIVFVKLADGSEREAIRTDRHTIKSQFTSAADADSWIPVKGMFPDEQ